jgi:hypothetical protein
VSSQAVTRNRAERGQKTSMSMRQIAYSVTQGRKVTIESPAAKPAEGYIAGLDDENYLILCPEQTRDNRPTFIRRTMPRVGAVITFHDERTFNAEPCFAEMDEIVTPYRTYLARNVLGRQNQQSSRKG